VLLLYLNIHALGFRTVILVWCASVKCVMHMHQSYGWSICRSHCLCSCICLSCSAPKNAQYMLFI